MDVESFLIDWFGKIFTVPCYGDVPRDRPERFITVERTGGPHELAMDRPTLAIQCWAQSRAQASVLAQTVCLALDELDAEPEVFYAKITGPYNFPTAEQEPRYQLVLNMGYCASSEK
jgi:hypothetical protein